MLVPGNGAKNLIRLQAHSGIVVVQS